MTRIAGGGGRLLYCGLLWAREPFTRRSSSFAYWSQNLVCASSTRRKQESSRCFSKKSDVKVLLEEDLDWDNRQALQEQWTNDEKGWKVSVEWKETPSFGIGLFAKEDIEPNTLLRRGILGCNLMEFQSLSEIDDFCQSSPSRIAYVSDYMWGFLDNTMSSSDEYPDFVGMWIPGNGLNHCEQPNTIYQRTDQGIDLVSLTPIQKGDELVDDYRRHGVAPPWVLPFARQHNVTLNFRGWNDFVHANEND